MRPCDLMPADIALFSRKILNTAELTSSLFWSSGNARMRSLLRKRQQPLIPDSTSRPQRRKISLMR